MEIKRRSANAGSSEVIVLDVSGKINVDNYTALVRAVESLVYPQGKRRPSCAVRLLINLEKVPLVDSTGLGGIISSQVTVTNARGVFRLCSVGEKVQGLIDACELRAVFAVYPNEQSALAMF